MKRTIEISASYSGKIPMGNYENENPFYSVKEVLEDCDWIDAEIKERQKQLQNVCYDQFKQQAEFAKMERITNEFKNMRFYDRGEYKYPSVTSIIGWDKDFFMNEEELGQYAARGTIIDKQVEIYLQTGEWKEPKDIPEIYPELVMVKKGALGLALDDVDFPSFFLKYPFKVIDQQMKVFNDDHKYAGRSEIQCIIESSNMGEWEKIDGILFDVPTLLDVKATSSLDKTYVMKQNTAYVKCPELKDIGQIGAIHLTKNNKCGYAKPVIETNLDKYWTLFLRDRENFKKRYGI